MCGITGYINKKNKTASVDIVNATDSIKHRGPDAEGYYLNENNGVYFGHRRLSVLDLSTAANQPFYSNDKRYIIIYNGEIYNFNNLKQSCHLETVTTSDTEVIVEIFAQHGIRSFSWLDGMFAFAIYDTIKNKIYIVRDRFGIKPLFYYFDGEQFAFASELKALKQISSLKFEINTAVFPEFLHLGFISQPNTIYKNVYKFPTGTYLEIDLNKEITELKFNKYWQIDDAIKRHTIDNEQQAISQLKTLLFNAVEKQLISDVPVGTFLSGGIDSSLITAIASKIKTDKIKTFSIGYDSKKYDESEYALKVAKYLGTEHYAYKLTEDEVSEILSEIISHYDEPFADASAYPTMIVSKLASKHVSVVLSGDGADELFLGYGMYNWASRLANPIIQKMRTPLYWATQHINQTYKRGGLLLDYPSLAHVHSHIFSQEQYLHSEKDLKHLLLDENFNFDRINQTVKTEKRVLNPKGKQSLWDINHYLKDDLLVKLDRASMKYSLESRVPYLDHLVVEYAINVNANLRFHKGISKYILKEILYDYLPKEFFNRPKWGFAVPLQDWLRGRFNFLLDKYLNSTIINRYGILNNLYVQELKNRFLAGEDYLYARLWTIIILHWWLEENT